MSKELLTKLDTALKLSGYAKRYRQSYVRAVRQLMNFAVPIQRIRELICALYELLRKCPVKVKPPDKPKPLKCPRCQGIMNWWRFIPPLRFVT